MQDGIADRLNAFTVELDVSPQPLNVSSPTGNDTLVDFSAFPMVSLTGTRFLQVYMRTLIDISVRVGTVL